MSGGLDGRFCRRCLLEESGEAAYARTVAEYVKALTPAVRVPEAE